MTTLKVARRRPTTSVPLTRTEEHPRVWPFPTYKGVPYCRPRVVRSRIDLSRYEEALI